MNFKSLLLLGLCGALWVGCGGGKSPVPEKPAENVGSCTYVNGFSKRTECREYRGAEWTEADATQDCKNQNSSIELGKICDYAEQVGQCVLGKAAKYTWITFPGNDKNQCSSSKTGCEFFGGGIFSPSALCADVPPGTGGTGLPTFEWPDQVCVPPKPGDTAGKGPNGQICTWQMISGATEEGRHFEEYASCDRVRTQRPYYGAPTAPDATRDDARMQDPAYTAEVSWVKSQIQATACVCCHSTAAPKGTSNWYVDQPGNFLNGFHNRGIAMGAGWINTVGFGAFPPEQNNGFFRSTPSTPNDTIFVTTDPERMKKFFLAEAAARGMKPEDYAATPYGAGPLDDQRFYQPGACTSGEGVHTDGSITWQQGPARYVYVMNADSPSPGVPPNLDLPPGVQWRIDVPYTGEPIASGAVKYGTIPPGFVQRAPATGAPAPLVSGQRYYLYVLADIAIPNTRCVFTAP
jgi:hypothetical protein